MDTVPSTRLTCRDCPCPITPVAGAPPECQPVLCVVCRRRVRKAAEKRRRSRLPKGVTHEKKELPLHVRVRQFVNEQKIGKPCIDCGNTFPPVAMDFDHRPGEVKIKDVAKIFTFAAATAEIAKCDLVCACCHRIRTWQRRQGT